MLWVPPTRSNSRFLKDAQQGDLRFGWHVADLVEEDCPMVRDFEASGMPLSGAGEGPFLIAEELGRHQRRWSDSAIHPCENRPGCTRPLVNRANDQLFSRATLTGDQNSGIARSNSHHLRGHAADRLGRTDDLLEHGRRQNLVAKIERFLVQLSVDSSKPSHAVLIASSLSPVSAPIRAHAFPPYLA